MDILVGSRWKLVGTGKRAKYVPMNKKAHEVKRKNPELVDK